MKQEKMKAAVFEGNGVLTVKDVPVPTLKQPSDVLLRVEAASICGSDLHILSVPPGQCGDPGTIMGHEFVARVEQVGDAVQLVRPGDRVVVEPNIRCGICPECRGGHENLCRAAQNIGQWRDGGFAEYCVVPEKQLHPIPEDIPAKLAALAEPLACVTTGMMRLNPMPHEKVLLFGAGAIGLIFLRMLRAYGVQDIAVCETMESRRASALECGADFVIDSSKPGWQETLEQKWGSAADASIDAVGAGAIFEQAVQATACGGRILIFGQNLTQTSHIRPGEINQKELTVMATLSTLHSFPPAIRMLSNPRLGLERLVTHELPLLEIQKGIDLMRSREAVKVVIYPNKK